MTDLTEVLALAIEEKCSCCDPRDKAAFANAAQSAIAALDAAGYQIVPKARCALCDGTRIDEYGDCPDCDAEITAAPKP